MRISINVNGQEVINLTPGQLMNLLSLHTIGHAFIVKEGAVINTKILRDDGVIAHADSEVVVCEDCE